MAKYGYFPTFLEFPIFWYSPLFPDARSQNFEQQFHPETIVINVGRLQQETD